VGRFLEAKVSADVNRPQAGGYRIYEIAAALASDRISR